MVRGVVLKDSHGWSESHRRGYDSDCENFCCCLDVDIGAGAGAGADAVFVSKLDTTSMPQPHKVVVYVRNWIA